MWGVNLGSRLDTKSNSIICRKIQALPLPLAESHLGARSRDSWLQAAGDVRRVEKDGDDGGRGLGSVGNPIPPGLEP